MSQSPNPEQQPYQPTGYPQTGYPQTGSQPSGSQPYGQEAYAGYQQYPSAGQPQAAPGYDYQAQPGPQGQWAPPAKAAGEPGFIKALFDLRFNHFVSIKFASIIYVIAIVLAGLTWLWYIVIGFMMGFAVEEVGSDYSPIMGILAIFLGWIPAVIQIVVSRVILEFLVSGVRTAQNTTKLVELQSK
jgi:hypothetical protein